VLCVHKNIPINDLNDFTSWVRANPTAFYASPGKGTHHHLFMEKLLQHLNITLEHVPYKGAASAVNDLIAGQIPIMFLPIQVAVPMRDDARLRIVGGSLKERHPSFLDIPSLHELGATNYHADPWFSIWGSPKLSSQQADKYRAGIVDALNSTAIKESLNKQGLIVKTSTGPELQNKNRMESEMWAKVINLAHIRPE
jgi:tripartite-type tricarboxylate transporter receptor subunit TctC